MTRPSRSRRLGLLALAAALPLSLGTAGVASADVAGAGAVQAADADHPWLDPSLAPEERTALLLDAMTLAQKFQQLSGTPPEIVPELPQCYGGRHVRGIAELGIPTLRITNGPVGVGQNDCVDAALLDLPPAQRPLGVPYIHPSSAKATALPSATTAAASFDPGVAGTYGDVIGTEMNNLALHVFEAPGVNMARLPILGRNFEYFGEDPFLAGSMAVAETRAVQEQGLIAMPKHYAANEQETNRQVTNSVVDERTLHETYLLPFEMAIKDGDAASVMCAYNYVNGVPSCESEYLLEDVLREQWGFEGYVQSDFFATKSTVPTLLNGMDHMMPVPQQWAPALLQAALDAGQISEADIDLALTRRYVQMFTYGIFDRPLVQTPIDYDAGGEQAYEIGTQGSVLLQNNGALPIPSDVQDVVVIGKATQVYAQQAVAGGALVGRPFGSGGGSSDVVPVYSVDPVEGLQNTLRELGNTTGQVRLVLVDDANQTATIDGQAVGFDAALAEAAGADSVVIMAGTISEEGADRATFADATGTQLVDIGDDLDWYADNLSAIATVGGTNPAKNSNTVAMIKAVMGAGPSMVEKTSLVLKDNAGVAMDPALVGEQGPSILEAWFPGQEDGNIVADLLFGVVNPSGKSPVTYPFVGKGFLDHIGAEHFPGTLVGTEQIPLGFGGRGGTITGRPTVEYTEGVNIGYRWYEANLSGDCPTAQDGSNPCVAFPFGHGLSYTDFDISGVVVAPPVSTGTEPVTVRLSVTNTGDVAGSEVVQVYVGLPVAAGEPAKRLVAFEKVDLEPGQRQQVELEIDPAASHHPMSVWDAATDAWTTPEGELAVHVGTSSASAELVTRVLLGAPGVPQRILDVPAVAPGGVTCFPVAGRYGVPDDATGVVVNVTAVGPDGPGYAVVFPDSRGGGRTPMPATSTVNFEPGQAVANSTFVPLPENGDLCYATKGAAQVRLLVDLHHHLTAGSGVVLGAPARILDTRPLGVGEIDGPVPSREIRTVKVAGTAGVPADAESVLLNVTTAGVTGVGNLRVFPGGQTVPTSSVVNYAPGVDKANATVVDLSDDGTISFWSDSARPAHVILDVLGHTTPGSAYTGITPTRVVDTRAATRVGDLPGPLAARTAYAIALPAATVPADATAVVLNVTAIHPTTAGNLRVRPGTDGTPPHTSTISYIPGRDIPNQVVVPLGADGQVSVWSDQDGGTVDLAVDVVGYLAP